MRQIIAIFFLIFAIGTSFAQTQQGVVKTRGRMVNGQLVAGQKLSGVTVTLNFGNALVSGQNGLFSFNVPSGKRFSLVKATKQGYTLADPECAKRSFSYSAKNPFYVVLEDENQRQADINEATRKVRKTMNAQLQKREEEIEALKTQNKITEQEYQNRIKELYDTQEQSQQLVKEMAERYASTDYDQLDAFDQQVQMYIEEGELQKADSMIRCKGTFESRIELVQKSERANRKREKELRDELDHLKKSKVFASKEKETIAADLFKASIIAQQQYYWDEAINYLKMRADLDTTNVIWNHDVANILSNQSLWLQSFDYYERALRHVQDSLTKADVLNAYGYSLWRHGDKDRAKERHLATLVCDPRLNPANNQYSDNALAFHYNSIAISSTNIEEFGKYAKLALELYRKLSDNYHTAISCNNVGAYYANKSDIENALVYYKEAYTIDSTLCVNSPDNEDFRSSLAWIGRVIGETYLKNGDKEMSRIYLEESKINYKILSNINFERYRPHFIDVDHALIDTYYELLLSDSVITCRERLNENLGYLYEKDPERYIDEYYNNLYLLLLLQRKFDEAIKLAEQSIVLDKSVEVAKFYLVISYNEKAYEHIGKDDFNNALATINKALSIRHTFRYLNAHLYDTKGEIFLMQGLNNEALDMWKKVLELDPHFLDQFPEGTTLSNGLKKLGLIE